MKSFFTWLLKSTNGRMQIVYWTVYYFIFWREGFKVAASCITHGEMFNAKIMFYGAIIVAIAISLLTANEYRIRKK